MLNLLPRCDSRGSLSAGSAACSSCPSTPPRLHALRRGEGRQAVRHDERSLRAGALPGSAAGGAAQHHLHPSVPTRAVLDATAAQLTPSAPSFSPLPPAPPAPRQEPRADVGECGFSLDFSAHYTFSSSKPIGEGQYGVVYQAQHRATGRMVAVKVVNKDRSDRTRADHLLSIRSEVALWRVVQDCRFVVRLEGVYEDAQCVYLVQQLCTGGDLRTVLNSGRLSEKEAAQVMRSVIEVVHACHANHHVYGDCKPANFLLLHPHRATGCQQFPQPRRKGDPAAPPHDGGVVPLAPPPPPQQQQQQPLTGVVVNGVVVAGGVANNVTPLPPRRHTDTIREHLLASFLLPTVPGAASCSGQSFDAPPSSSSASSSSSSSTPAAPPQQLAAAGGVPPLASERCDQLAARAEAAAAAAAAAESDGGCPLLGQTAASSAPAGLRVLADALPLESWVLHQQCSQPEAPQGGDGAAAAAARARALHLERCGLQCHEEMTVLATDFGCCQPLCQAPAGQRGLARGLTSGKRLGSPVYMAPEMWQAGALVNPGVDVWAAGVMLYQLLSGRYPFWPLSPEQIDEGQLQLYQVVCGIQSNPVLFEGEPWARVSRPCKDLIRAMLERQPHVRISAKGVLRHPWMTAQLGYSPVLPYDHQGAGDHAQQQQQEEEEDGLGQGPLRQRRQR